MVHSHLLVSFLLVSPCVLMRVRRSSSQSAPRRNRVEGTSHSSNRSLGGDLVTVFYGDASGKISLTAEQERNAEAIVRKAYTNVPGGNVVQNRGIPLASYYNCWAVVKDDTTIYALIMGWIPDSEYKKPCARMNNVKIGVVAANGKHGKTALRDLGARLLRSDGLHRWWVEVSPPLFWSWIKIAPVVKQPVAVWSLVGNAKLKSFCSKEFRGAASFPVEGCFERMLGDEVHEKIILGCPTDMSPSKSGPHPYVGGSELEVCGYERGVKTQEIRTLQRLREAAHENNLCDMNGLLETGVLRDHGECSMMEEAENNTAAVAKSQKELQQAFLQDLRAGGVVRNGNQDSNAAYLCRIPEDICLQTLIDGNPGKHKRIKAQEWLRFMYKDDELVFVTNLACADVMAYYYTEKVMYPDSIREEVKKKTQALNAAMYPSRKKGKTMKKYDKKTLIKLLGSTTYLRPWGQVHDLSKSSAREFYVVSPSCLHDTLFGKIWILDVEEVNTRYDAAAVKGEECAATPSCPGSIAALESLHVPRPSQPWRTPLNRGWRRAHTM